MTDKTQLIQLNYDLQCFNGILLPLTERNCAH